MERLFLLLFSDAILDEVVGHQCCSFVDGFLGYNQVKIALEDQSLTTFIIDWETFANNVMSFGLCNAPPTFQRVMITTFQQYLRKFIEIFLDDFCVFSSKADHKQCLKKCFEHCEKYGISINAAKFEFVVPCRQLVDHIVSQHGIGVDPEKVSAILKLDILDHMIALKGFLEATRYYRKLIYFYAEVPAPLTHLTKQIDTPRAWTEECTKAFNKLKKWLSSAPMLISLD